MAQIKNYEQLSLEERCQISTLRQMGTSVRKIAASLDRSPSTITRELKRNLSSSLDYKPAYAHQITRSRRWSGSKLIRFPDLQKTVFSQLAQGFSPEQVAGRLALERGTPVISYESIYRFIYAQIARTKDYAWRHYLPRSKSKRGLRGKKGGSSALTIHNRASIHQRPLQVLTRKQKGHWEADLMSFSKYGQYLLTSHERQSRLMILRKLPNKSASSVVKELSQIFCKLPNPLRKTITFDNGTEFAKHENLHSLKIKTFFCDTHSPWQKGGIENAIGRMRRVLPRKTDLASLSHKQLHRYMLAYNHTPRKCLGFRTPAEVFLSQLLHFKCESTSLPSQG